MDTNVVEIDRYVAASPGTVYALVSDIARMATGAPGRVSAAGSAPRLARSWEIGRASCRERVCYVV